MTGAIQVYSSSRSGVRDRGNDQHVATSGRAGLGAWPGFGNDFGQFAEPGQSRQGDIADHAMTALVLVQRQGRCVRHLQFHRLVSRCCGGEERGGEYAAEVVHG